MTVHPLAAWSLSGVAVLLVVIVVLLAVARRVYLTVRRVVVLAAAAAVLGISPHLLQATTSDPAPSPVPVAHETSTGPALRFGQLLHEVTGGGGARSPAAPRTVGP